MEKILLCIILHFFEPVRLTKDYNARVEQTQSYIPLIVQAAAEYNIDPILLITIIRDESSFNPAAHGAKGEVGLTQVMPRLFPGFDLTKPTDQIRAGAYNLKAGAIVCGEYGLDRILGYYGSGKCNGNKNWIRRRIARYNRAKQCK